MAEANHNPTPIADTTSTPTTTAFFGVEAQLCEWLNSRYECDPSIDPSDAQTLVDALADGTVLCHFASDLAGRSNGRRGGSGGTGNAGGVGQPKANRSSSGSSSSSSGSSSKLRVKRTNSKAGNLFQSNERIRKFATMCEAMGVEALSTLSPSDLRDNNSAKAMGCLMRLYRMSR